MPLLVYTVRDSKVGVYNPPFYQKTQGEAIRTFHRLASDPTSNVSRYPEDFDLFEIGKFWEESGTLEPVDAPIHVRKALDLLQKS